MVIILNVIAALAIVFIAIAVIVVACRPAQALSVASSEYRQTRSLDAGPLKLSQVSNDKVATMNLAGNGKTPMPHHQRCSISQCLESHRV